MCPSKHTGRSRTDNPSCTQCKRLRARQSQSGLLTKSTALVTNPSRYPNSIHGAARDAASRPRANAFSRGVANCRDLGAHTPAHPDALDANGAAPLRRLPMTPPNLLAMPTNLRGRAGRAQERAEPRSRRRRRLTADTLRRAPTPTIPHRRARPAKSRLLDGIGRSVPGTFELSRGPSRHRARKLCRPPIRDLACARTRKRTRSRNAARSTSGWIQYDG